MFVIHINTPFLYIKYIKIFFGIVIIMVYLAFYESGDVNAPMKLNNDLKARDTIIKSNLKFVA